MKSYWKVLFEGEEEDDVFDSEEEALDYASYLISCTREGAEILNMSNPGDNEYDEETWEDPDVEVIEIEEDE